MISHKYRFICFRIPKSASSSIRKALIPFSDKKISVRTDVKSIMGNLNKQGLTLDLWKKYFKFAFVRNPWDRAVSRYFYSIKKNDCFNQSRVIEEDYKKDFYQFIKVFEQKGREKIYQFDFLADNNGKIQVDFIGRVETLQKDLDKVCEIISLPSIVVPHLNKTIHNNYKKYYTEESVEIVRKKFKKDIEYFGYEF